MALTKSEKIDMVQLAMKRVNVVPYEENAIQFGTNMKTVEISEDAVTVCEAYINVTQENRTCHIGFSVVLSQAVVSEFYLEWMEMREQRNTGTRMQPCSLWTSFFLEWGCIRLQ